MYKKINTQSAVLESTYRLMFQYNIEGITMVELEKKLKRTRGSIYYFYKDKTALFKAVIDGLFFPVIDTFCFNNKYKFPFDRLMESVQSYDSSVNPAKAIINILVQSDKFYPNFSSILNSKLIYEKECLITTNPQLSELIEYTWTQKVGTFFLSAYEFSSKG
ncbi:MAG: TetR/AcrR family transcriptional regulator [Lachnospiraceae bacterium]|nr:TetR/AcrR family transcriptional regulator [Lachnospiraceae bacterium]